MSRMTSRRELLERLPETVSPQRGWGEDDYLWLTERSNRLIEFVDGVIDVLPYPTSRHQGVLGKLTVHFHNHLQPRGGDLLFAPFCLRLWRGRYRTPELLMLLDKHDPRSQNEYWLGADLVLEVVNAEAPERDLVEKRQEYAAAGIPEYWIVDPSGWMITVLVLDDDTYEEHGVFGRGERATSRLLAGFGVDVDAVFGVE